MHEKAPGGQKSKFSNVPRTHMLQTLADPEAAHKVKVRFYQLESISKSLKCSAIRYLSKMCETSNYAGGKNARNSTLKQLQNSACRSSTFLSPALRSWRATRAA